MRYRATIDYTTTYEVEFDTEVDDPNTNDDDAIALLELWLGGAAQKSFTAQEALHKNQKIDVTNEDCEVTDSGMVEEE